MVMNILIISILSFVVNIYLGRCCTKYRKMSFKWVLMIHASIPLIIPLRIWLDTPRVASLLFIGLAVAGQLVGIKFWPVKQ